MKLPTIGMLWVSGCLLGGSLSLEGGTVQFAGYDWTVKSGTGGPGPNVWDERNVWVDELPPHLMCIEMPIPLRFTKPLCG